VHENRISQFERAKLKINFLEKTRNIGGHTYFTFISELNISGRENPRVIKTKEDFKILQKIVRDQASKQAVYFSDSVFLPADKNFSHNVPYLEVNLPQAPNPTMSRSLISSDSSMDMSRDIILQQIKHLENFCNEVIRIKLFWTKDVLNFFEVPKDLHDIFERERSKYEKQCKAFVEGKERHDSGRR